MQIFKNVRIRQALSLAFNVAIVVLTWYSVLLLIFGDESGNMTLGSQTFRYFTNLSNILVAVTASLLIPFNINSLLSGKDEIPLWALLTKFVGTVSVTVTFLTVVLFLGPTMGWEIMFAGPCLFLHLITPLLAILSFVLLESNLKIKFPYSFLGLAPTFVYSLIYLFTVAVTKVWPDFYGFTFGGKMWTIPLSLLAMYIATYAFSLGLWKLHNLCEKRLLH